MKRLLLLAATVALGACADPVDRSTDWNYLHATIIEPSCATSGCHSAMTANGELDLSSPDQAYLDLTATTCTNPCEGSTPAATCGRTCDVDDDGTPEDESDCTDPDDPPLAALGGERQLHCLDEEDDLLCFAGSASCSCRVVPANHIENGLDSNLMSLLRGAGAEALEYQQMPIDLPLAPAEIALIEQWIEAGAPCE